MAAASDGSVDRISDSVDICVYPTIVLFPAGVLPKPHRMHLNNPTQNKLIAWPFRRLWLSIWIRHKITHTQMG